MTRGPSSFDRELDVALAAAHEAGGILLRHYAGASESWEKSEDNPLTKADLESDQAIARHLRRAFPEDALLSEETAADPDRTSRRRAWIVDPMDGTKEFVARIPEYAVSIALVEDGEPVVGVILNPAAAVAIFGARGAGTWRAGWSERAGVGARERARVSACPRLSDAVVIASRTEISRGKFTPYADWFRELRPVGSIAWKLGCVACGDGDLNVSVAPKNEWDVCAGDLLVREAGGVYVDFAGAPRRYNQPNPLIEAFMAAGPRPLVEAFCARERARAQPVA
jgi:myo-inositol-1(or 4)-monophosphatase